MILPKHAMSRPKAKARRQDGDEVDDVAERWYRCLQTQQAHHPCRCPNRIQPGGLAILELANIEDHHDLRHDMEFTIDPLVQVRGLSILN